MQLDSSYYVSHTKLAREEVLTADITPDSKIHEANMGPTWVLSAPDAPHAGPMKLAIGDSMEMSEIKSSVYVFVYTYGLSM